MKQAVIVFQIVLSIFLVVLILMQSKGTGFARSWTSTGASFTRRGLEKIVFRATFIVAALFVIISVIQVTL